jgi:hypothetical protein
LGYGQCTSTFSGFSRKHGITDFRRQAPPHHISELISRICLRDLPTCLNRNPITGSATLLHPRITPYNRYRNINLFSIDYAFRPRLRSRLTLGGLPFPRKPWASGEQVFHLLVATNASIRSCRSSSIPHGKPSLVTTILPYHHKMVQSFGGTLETRYIFHARALDQ